MAELVDARDLKSLGSCNCASSILAPGTRNFKGLRLFGCNPFFCVFFRGVVPVNTQPAPWGGTTKHKRREACSGFADHFHIKSVKI